MLDATLANIKINVVKLLDILPGEHLSFCREGERRICKPDGIDT